MKETLTDTPECISVAYMLSYPGEEQEAADAGEVVCACPHSLPKVSV